MTTEQNPDAERAGQPGTSRTAVTYEGLVPFTRARQVEEDRTEPAFWLLLNLR
ncbi:hypothetical protein ACFY7C_00560 [Streptomyces sp. NPDC012769]|uniref:hypothetical protein n=1 Tax=Streptomyces sp. NPDC012769 TaxID=3364848 RepID=UPI0036CB1F98